jgi:hypothetical protein
MTSYRTMSKKIVKKVKNYDSMGKTKLGSFSHLVACRNSLENTRKMNLKLILNKTSPHAHTKSEFDVPSVPRKLVKYVVHSSKRKN